MKRVFISVGMNGRADEEVERDIRRARRDIEEHYPFEEIELVDNWSTVGPENAGRLWYLGEAIKKLGTCDVCYFVDGWKKHKGCVAEYEICKLYGIDIIEGS